MVLVCCVFMFPGMSCSVSCLFCFHVCQECHFLLCFHVSWNVVFCFLFVCFSCFQECHVLLLVVFSCCPGMSYSGSCLLHFHVSTNVMFWFLFDVFSCFPGMWCSDSCLLCFRVSRNAVFWFMFPGMWCSDSCLLCFHVSQECHVLVHVCCVFVFPRNVVFWFIYEEKLCCCVCRISYHRAESRNPKPGEEVDPEQVNSCLLKHQGHSLEFSAGRCSHTLENPDALHPVCSSGDGQPLCSSVNMA